MILAAFGVMRNKAPEKEDKMNRICRRKREEHPARKEVSRFFLLFPVLFFGMLWLSLNDLKVLADEAAPEEITYDVEAAFRFADSHCREDEQAKVGPTKCKNGWYCAAFVSKCLQAGGIDVYNRRCTYLRDDLLATGLWTEYIIPLTGEPICIEDVPGELSLGDLIFYYCPKETDGRPFVHVQLFCGWSTEGMAKMYSHNYRVIGTEDNYTNCNECGAELSYAYILHFTQPMEGQKGPYPANQWMTVSGGKYHINARGFKDTGWRILGGKWYYFDLSGVMQVGWKQISGEWYYFNSSGVMQTGWKKISGRWFYFKPDGAMQTGWKMLAGSWYYFNSAGVMQTGWYKCNGRWYYSDASGVMQTGWLPEAGQWYYLDPSGAMQTGWKKIRGEWYYFHTSGVMQTGWKKLGGEWYFFGTDGSMQTGLTEIDGKIYYFVEEGSMQTGRILIDGHYYFFADTGVLVYVKDKSASEEPGEEEDKSEGEDVEEDIEVGELAE